VADANIVEPWWYVVDPELNPYKRNEYLLITNPVKMHDVSMAQALPKIPNKLLPTGLDNTGQSFVFNDIEGEPFDFESSRISEEQTTSLHDIDFDNAHRNLFSAEEI